MFFINCRYEILCSRRIQTFQSFLYQDISFILRFDHEYDSLEFCRNLHLLCLIIDINQKQIIQKQILNKPVLIHPFFVYIKKIPKLTGSHTSCQFHAVCISMQHQYIYRITVFIDAEHSHLIQDHLFRFFFVITEILNLDFIPGQSLIRPYETESLHIPYCTVKSCNLPDILCCFV